jgi:CRISPR system Cascade subunit CasD
VAKFLLIRLEGPLQAWGDVALDPRRPTRDFPSRSALTGLLANALGWHHMDGQQITALQDSLRYAVREDRTPRRIVDYQTADLGRIGRSGWTRWGVEERGGSAADGTQLLWKHYLADGSFLVALTLDGRAPVTLDYLEAALRRPARPLFLGRKSCPPALPLLERPRYKVDAATSHAALAEAPLADMRRDHMQAGYAPGAIDHSPGATIELRCWYAPGDGPPAEPAQLQQIWDRRDFSANRFEGGRRIVQGSITLAISTDTTPSEGAT